jgi:hypothetical protein
MSFPPLILIMALILVTACVVQAEPTNIYQNTPGESVCALTVTVKRGEALYLGLAAADSKVPPASACCFVLVSVPKNFPKAQWALRILTRIKVEGGPDGKAAAYSIAWSPVADGVELMGEGTGGGSSLSMKPATSAVSALKFNDFDDSNAALQTPVEITMTTGHMTLTKKLLVEVKDARTILADIPTDLSPKREIKPLVWEGSGAPRSLPRATELVVVPVAGH